MTGAHESRRAIRSLNRVGFFVVVVLVVGIGGWAATTELVGAVIAPGTIVVESSVKKVQHPTGGIVSEILVKEGDIVEAGQVIVRLDDTVTRSTLGIVRSQRDELTAREARLLAERDGVDKIVFPDTLTGRSDDATIATALVGEEKLFDSRRSTRRGQKSQLVERIAQTNQEIEGLSAQLSGKEKEIKFLTEELVGVTDLYEKKLIPIIRYMQLQRDQAKLQGDRGQHIAEIARARVKISETELQILQIDHDFRTELLKELRDVQGRIAELKERVAAAEDQLKRVEIRAPQNGMVHQLAIHTVGGVIANGETVMQIVPQADELVVEAKVAPQDIDQLVLGAQAVVRIMAGNPRTTPVIDGILSRISADLTRDQQTGQTYYVVRATLSGDQLQRLGDLKLAPGMPAEVFIRTHERTPLEYLVRPLHDQIARTFRER